MNYILVKFCCNYANSFDVCGFRIFENSEWDDYLKELDNKSWPQFIFFEKDKCFEFVSKEDLMSCYHVIKIGKVEKTTLMKNLLNEDKYYGNFIYIDNNSSYLVSKKEEFVEA